jgi:hypothetical protein
MDMSTEIWVVASGAAYAAVMVATPEVKPGLLLDRMEAQLLAAEESRSLPEPVMATKVVDLSSAAVAQPSRPAQAPRPAPEARPAKTEEATKPQRPVSRGTVDRVALAREFGRLLDDSPGSS